MSQAVGRFELLAEILVPTAILGLGAFPLPSFAAAL